MNWFHFAQRLVCHFKLHLNLSIIYHVWPGTSVKAEQKLQKADRRVQERIAREIYKLEIQTTSQA